MTPPPDDMGTDGLQDTFDLDGKTLTVYWWLMVQNRAVTRREVQEGAGLSSASLAGYHLKKLQGLGLVEEYGLNEYRVAERVQVGMMRFYFLLRDRMIPRFLLYSTFYGTALLGTLVLLPALPITLLFFVWAVLGFGLVSSIYETIVLFRSRPYRPLTK